MKGIYRKGEARKQLREKKKGLVWGQDTFFRGRGTAGVLSCKLLLFLWEMERAHKTAQAIQMKQGSLCLWTSGFKVSCLFGYAFVLNLAVGRIHLRHSFAVHLKPPQHC